MSVLVLAVMMMMVMMMVLVIRKTKFSLRVGPCNAMQ